MKLKFYVILWTVAQSQSNADTTSNYETTSTSVAQTTEESTSTTFETSYLTTETNSTNESTIETTTSAVSTEAETETSSLSTPTVSTLSTISSFTVNTNFADETSSSENEAITTISIGLSTSNETNTMNDITETTSNNGSTSLFGDTESTLVTVHITYFDSNSTPIDLTSTTIIATITPFEWNTTNNTSTTMFEACYNDTLQCGKHGHCIANNSTEWDCACKHPYAKNETTKFCSECVKGYGKLNDDCVDVCELPDVCGYNYAKFSCSKIDGEPYCSCPIGYYNDTGERSCLLANVTYEASVELLTAVFISELDDRTSTQFTEYTRSFCNQTLHVYGVLNASMSCSVKRFSQGSIMVDYVLGFASVPPDKTLLNATLSEYMQDCKQNCFGMNSGATFIGDYRETDPHEYICDEFMATDYNRDLKRCVCKLGYQSLGSDVIDGTRVDRCFDVNECLIINSTICGPGNCSNFVGSYICSCPTGMTFNGITCVESAISNTTIAPGCENKPCKNGGTCEAFGTGFQCKCSWLYQGIKCEDNRPLILFIVMILLIVAIVLIAVGCFVLMRRGRKVTTTFSSTESNGVPKGQKYQQVRGPENEFHSYNINAFEMIPQTYHIPRVPPRPKDSDLRYENQKDSDLRFDQKERPRPRSDASGAPRDALGAPRDASGAPRDTSGAPRDALGAPRDAFGAPRDAFGAPRDKDETNLAGGSRYHSALDNFANRSSLAEDHI